MTVKQFYGVSLVGQVGTADVFVFKRKPAIKALVPVNHGQG